MKIFLTGVNGFIGSTFARLAVAQGHQVAGLLRPGSTPTSTLRSLPNLQFISGTLEQVPWDEIAAFGPEACVHAAWLTTPGIYLTSLENQQLIEASVTLAQRLRELGSRHLVVLGTCFEYKPLPGLLHEDASPVEPASVYARAKNELRLRLEDSTEVGPLCWARVFYPYGPGEHASRLCSSITLRLMRDESVCLKTPRSTKDYIYVEDLAEAIRSVVTAGATGRINLGTGVGVEVREVAQTLGTLLGKPELVTEADPPELDPLPWVVADAAKLRALGWKPRVSLQDGLERLTASLR